MADVVRSTTVWLRHFERFIEDGDVPTREGDNVPNVPLVNVRTGNLTSLHQFVNNNVNKRRPLVVMAGSQS